MIEPQINVKVIEEDCLEVEIVVFILEGDGEERLFCKTTNGWILKVKTKIPEEVYQFSQENKEKFKF